MEWLIILDQIKTEMWIIWIIENDYFQNIYIHFFLFSWMLLITWWQTMFHHSIDSCISPTMKAIKFHSPAGISTIRWVNINHLNECTIVGIKFGSVMFQKFNVALFHHGLFSSRHLSLLAAITKHIQLHLLTTALVPNAAMAIFVSTGANDWDDIIWGVGQFLCSGGTKAFAERYTCMSFLQPGNV